MPFLLIFFWIFTIINISYLTLCDPQTQCVFETKNSDSKRRADSKTPSSVTFFRRDEAACFQGLNKLVSLISVLVSDFRLVFSFPCSHQRESQCNKKAELDTAILAAWPFDNLEELRAKMTELSQHFTDVNKIVSQIPSSEACTMTPKRGLATVPKTCPSKSAIGENSSSRLTSVNHLFKAWVIKNTKRFNDNNSCFT